MKRTVGAVVVGGGPAGYSATIRLAQRGIHTVCVEREAVGGVCLNWGCIPSKALITTAQRYDWARHGEEFGVVAHDVKLDLAKAQQRNRGIVRHHTEGVASLIASNGAELIKGTAELISPRELRVRRGDGSVIELQVERGIVLATGATPRALPGVTLDGERIVTAREAVFLEQVPEHLLVLGGGVIGLELGSAYQRLGSRLTVVEAAPALLPGVDADVVRVVQKRLLARGANVLTEARALGAERSADGVTLRVQHAGVPQVLSGSHLLVAAGFVPNSAGLGLETLGVTLDAHGHVLTNERCETRIQGVFAIGDVSGPPYLAHKAFKEAEVLADVLSGEPATRDWRAMPAAIFTDPEVATVGLTERQAAERGVELSVGRFPFSALGRAMALGESEGFVKLLSERGRLVGAAIVGAEASELITELTLAIEVGATLEDLALTVHSHPTLSEAIREAADAGLGRAVHILNRKPRRAA